MYQNLVVSNTLQTLVTDYFLNGVISSPKSTCWSCSYQKATAYNVQYVTMLELSSVACRKIKKDISSD